jgi:carbon storage regulator
MLVLSRKTSEAIRIGPDVRITIVRVGPNNVRVGIEAPKDLNIVREELLAGGGTIRVKQAAQA